ncbi:hypothetical protein OF83DRAFT_1122893 [Amylostereum chailletii]|nr:hypothetical protein OF83DRAFT_1122893 [Amylostereum chailletii]
MRIHPASFPVDTHICASINSRSLQIVSRVAEVTAVIAEIGGEQEALAKADAENEDALRALWTEIARLREQQKAITLRRAEAQRQINQQRRKANISSLAQISRACQDAVKVTDNLGS